MPKQLIEIAEIVMGQSPSGDSCNTSGEGVPLLNGPTEFGSYHPDPVQFTNDPKKLSQKGDLLFCVRGSTTGRMNWSDQAYAIGRGLAAIRARNGTSFSAFIKGCIEVSLPNLLMAATGSTFPSVSREQLETIEIEVPPDEYIRRVESFIGTLDDKIELNRKTNETIEGIAKALFKSWFVDFDPVRAKAEGRSAGLSDEINELFPDSFEESELGEIPSGWSVKKIGDVVIRLPVGQKFDKKTVSPSGVVPVLDQSSDGIIGFHDQAPGVLASESDPLFTFANHTCAMRFMMESFSVIQNVFPLKGQDVSTEWLYQATLGKQVITEYKGHYPDLIDREIVVPSKGLDFVFGDIFRSFARTQLASKKQSLTLEQLRDALLPRLISGELRVPDAEKMLEEAGV